MNARRIVIAGGSGFLGRLLSHHFANAGWDVVILTRRPEHRDAAVREAFWDGETLGDWTRELAGAAALVNLAGRSVNCRYTRRNRRLMMDSRLHSTRVLGEAVARCKSPPPVWLNFYKHSFGPAWDESGELGATAEAKDEFSIQIATAWESAFFEAQTPNTRKVALRSAMVLGHAKNSVYPALSNLARRGLGGPMAGGKQFVSWIHQTDFCRGVEWIITHNSLSGAVNLATPRPVTNAQMSSTLCKVWNKRFAFAPPLWLLEIGAFFLRTETELIIKSRRVVSRKLLQSGFQFCFVDIESAFRDLNQRPVPSSPCNKP